MFGVFKKRTLAFTRSSVYITFHYHNLKRLQLITRLRLRLRWLVGLKLIQFEQQKTQLPFIILAKNLKANALQGHKRHIKFFELEIHNLRVQIFRCNFQFSIFISQESSKRCLIFPTSLQFLRNEQICRQELLFNHILKEC